MSLSETWKKGRKIKEGGKEFIADTEIFIKGFIAPVAINSTFHECNDGW
jgi:hypothetical protein